MSTTWTNSWISNANREMSRCLLIGDSTIRQIRGSLEWLASGEFVVDLFASSLLLDDYKFLEYLKVFFGRDEYQYDIIIVQLGGRHGLEYRCCENEKIEQIWRKSFDEVMSFLNAKCKKIVVMSNTLKKDAQDEREITYRNSIVENYAKKNGLLYFDACNLMKNSSYSYDDAFHFKREADSYISYSLLMFLWKEGVIERNCSSYAARKIMIYGKGIGGQEIYWWLKWLGVDNRIVCFIESKCINEKEILGVPIVSIGNIIDKDDVDLIISSDKYEEEMIRIAKEYGFLNIVNRQKCKSMYYQNV